MVRADGGCANCGASFAPGAAFCSACGQKSGIHRLSLHEIGHELLHAFVHVDRSVLSLMRALILRPGGVALDFVSGKRKRYYGPFSFLVVAVAVASAAVALSGFKAVTSDVPNLIGNFLQRHVNLVFFVQVPLLAAASRLVCYRGRFNYAEYLVLAAYTSGMHVLAYPLLVIPVWYFFSPSPDVALKLYSAYAPLWPLYFGFAMSQFLPGRRVVSALLGIMVVLLTMAATTVLVNIVIRPLA